LVADAESDDVGFFIIADHVAARSTPCCRYAAGGFAAMPHASQSDLATPFNPS
jgi:hypothetical protein